MKTKRASVLLNLSYKSQVRLFADERQSGSNYRMTIGSRIILARQSLGWDQAVLARVLEARGIMTQQALSNLETGRSETTRQLVPIAVVLGVTPEWLQTGEGAMRPEQLQQGSLAPFPAPLAPLVAKLMTLHEAGHLEVGMIVALETILDGLKH